ncbi:DUF1641 domain-containing protein [Peribacillus kribbensis]|uniref:DUF1641 domain-containing protein n=1 Tax=Peribacillus kribbensis TaxID=356658 RepID=UPI0003FBDA93|nr:DUF1641 domain-containing protein [Peribacillus kribbensis]
MAKAIRQINKTAPNPLEEQSQALADIIKTLADNREGILSFMAILKNLQEIGILDALHAILEKRTDVGVIAMQQVNQPGMHNTIRNAIYLFNFMGTMKPEQLQSMLGGVTKGLERMGESIKNHEQHSLWQLGKSIRDPEIRAAMTTMMGFLHGMGESFSQHPEQELH